MGSFWPEVRALGALRGDCACLANSPSSTQLTFSVWVPRHPLTSLTPVCLSIALSGSSSYPSLPGTVIFFIKDLSSPPELMIFFWVPIELCFLFLFLKKSYYSWHSSYKSRRDFLGGGRTSQSQNDTAM